MDRFSTVLRLLKLGASDTAADWHGVADDHGGAQNLGIAAPRSML
jgi:hypothetical protein